MRLSILSSGWSASFHHLLPACARLHPPSCQFLHSLGLSPPFQIPVFEYFNRTHRCRSQFPVLLPSPGPRTAEAPRQSRLGHNLRLQNVIAGLFAIHYFQPLHEQHAHSSLVFDRVAFAAPCAEPIVLDGVPMGGLFLLLGSLLKAKQAPLPVIKIRETIRVGAFQVHKLWFGRLLHRLPQNEQKSKILASAKTVKLNKWIQRIRASFSTGGAFSVSRIEMRVTAEANNDHHASRSN